MRPKRILMGFGLAGVLFLSACNPNEPEIADISGRVIWDPYRDGTYEGVPQAKVILFKEKGDSLGFKTTDGDGFFFFSAVSPGDYTFYSQKITGSLEMYAGFKRISVSKATKDVGDLVLQYIGPLIPFPRLD